MRVVSWNVNGQRALAKKVHQWAPHAASAGGGGGGGGGGGSLSDFSQSLPTEELMSRYFKQTFGGLGGLGPPADIICLQETKMALPDIPDVGLNLLNLLSF